MIRHDCPSCERTITSADDLAGLPIRCPHCHVLVKVPRHEVLAVLPVTSSCPPEPGPLAPRSRRFGLFVPLPRQVRSAAPFLGTVQVVCGLLLAGLCGTGLLLATYEPALSVFLSIFFGLPLGLVLACAVSGAANFFGRRLRGRAWLLMPPLTAGLCVAAAPALSTWYQAARAANRQDVHRMQELLALIRTHHDGDCRFAPARNAALAGIKAQYDQAAARLTEDDGEGREFSVDAELRQALVTVLNDLAESGDPSVHLVFRDGSDLTPPPRAELELLLWRAGSRDGTPTVLRPDFLASAAAGPARGKLLLDTLRSAFGQVAAEPLLKLVPLDKKDKREGKFILEARAVTRHGGQFSKVTAGNQSNLVVEFRIDWEVRLYDRQGALLRTFRIQSRPAASLKMGSIGAGSAEAAYRRMLRSAYDNFGRALVGRAGRIPGPEKSDFANGH
jgi:hypothetical protein